MVQLLRAEEGETSHEPTRQRAKEGNPRVPTKTAHIHIRTASSPDACTDHQEKTLSAKKHTHHIPELRGALVGDGQHKVGNARAHVAGRVCSVAGGASHCHNQSAHHPAEEEGLNECFPNWLHLLGQEIGPLFNHQRAVDEEEGADELHLHQCHTPQSMGLIALYIRAYASPCVFATSGAAALVGMPWADHRSLLSPELTELTF